MLETLRPDTSLEISAASLLRKIGLQIRQSLELPVILEATTSEIQQFLQCDRVMIYQFQADGSGQVVTEHLGPENNLPSLYQLFFPADDIPESARQLFLAVGIRNVVDVKSRRIGQSRVCDPGTGETLQENWVFRPLDPCHAEYLTAMGVQMSLVIPILNQGKLWGLLVAHHATSMVIEDRVRDTLQLVVDQMSIAISQSILLKQSRQSAQREALLNCIAARLAPINALDLSTALQETIAIFQGSGGRLYLYPQPQQNSQVQPAERLYLQGNQPIVHTLSSISIFEEASAIDRYFNQSNCKLHQKSICEYKREYKFQQKCEDKYEDKCECQHELSHESKCEFRHSVWAVNNLYRVPELRNLQPLFEDSSIASLLIIPIVWQQQRLGYLTIFRDEVQTETLWAGQFDPDLRQSYPRQSFQAWKQICEHQVMPWTDEEIEVSQAIAHQFALAIGQSDLHHQIQSLNGRLQNLNADLERQVASRTADLQQTNLQQELLYQVVAKIRQSLNLETIFDITTKDVRQILGADRVAIYQFDLDSQFNDGEIIAEDVLPAFPSALAVKVHDHCFGERYAHLYRQGRVHAMADIHQVDLSDCYRAVLSQFAIQAILVAPIMRRDELWGLFCVHQCDRPRDWQPSEIKFIQQLSSQVSIALEQADLLHQTQRQATAMTQLVSELQKAQMQLVHQEKMSSLGRLVAGIAHEINNPVNFIQGNITYVNHYVQDLMHLLECYKAEIPQPSKELQSKIADIDWEFLSNDLPQTLSSMKYGTARIREIVLSLRNFSRLDEASFKAVDLHEGIESNLLILHHRLKATTDRPEIKITKDFSELPSIQCYASALNQVLMNILNNAIDAIEEKWKSLDPTLQKSHLNEILIQTESYISDHGDDWIRIQIQDNGIGISIDKINKIYDPFFTTKPVGQGTGLGLSVSHQIVTEHHHGKLSCFSSFGSGATFVIELPVYQASKRPPQ